MPVPSSPIMFGVDLPETIYAKDQPPYKPLPVWKNEDGTILSRWRLTWKERIMVLFWGDVYLWVKTFNQPLQPISMQIEPPEVK